MTKKELEELSRLEEEILELLDTKENYTRSDLQGRVSAIALNIIAQAKKPVVTRRKENEVNITKFKESVKFKDIKGNRTYLYASFDGHKYGKPYQNITNTRENMLDNFVVTYYPFVEKSVK